MASRISKITLRNVTQVRNYAQAAPCSGITTCPVEITTLANKMVVASSDNGSLLTRVSVQFKAGSRNESPDQAGATHMMRIAAGLSTKNMSQFAISRNVQQLGANLYCSTDREVISYTLEGMSDAVVKLLPFLGEIATQQALRPWEVEENLHRVKIELASRPPQQRAVDLLHKAAYRTGLGNSIYMAKSQLGKLESESLQHYINQNFLANRCAVVGMGIDHCVLTDWATKLCVNEGKAEIKKSPYKGGEIRSDKGGELAFVAIGTESAGLTSRDALAFCVLKYAMGSPPSVKYGQSSGILARAIGHGNYGISAINLPYSDSGLFGVLVATDAENACNVVVKAMKALTTGEIKQSDFKKGQNTKKMEIISACESCDALDFVANNVLFTGKAPNCKELLEDVESLTIDDVQNAATKICKGKLSIAAVGNLKNVPFLDEFV